MHMTTMKLAKTVCPQLWDMLIFEDMAYKNEVERSWPFSNSANCRNSCTIWYNKL